MAPDSTTTDVPEAPPAEVVDADVEPSTQAPSDSTADAPADQDEVLDLGALAPDLPDATRERVSHPPGVSHRVSFHQSSPGKGGLS